MCVLSIKEPIQKKSGNLWYALCILSCFTGWSLKDSLIENKFFTVFFLQFLGKKLPALKCRLLPKHFP